MREPDGAARQAADRVLLPTRREALRVGVSAFGLTLPALLSAGSRAARAGAKPSRAKSVVIFYLNGGPSQLDTWDMKPHAPLEVRGSFRPIPTNVPGIHICEHMPRMARIADKYTIIRSMSHDESDHLKAGYLVMTGGRLARPIDAFSGVDRNDVPHFGSILSKNRPSRGLPPFVVIPELVSPRGVARPGQHAGFLGARFDPYVIASDPNLPSYDAGPLASSSATAADRLGGRRALLRSLERVSRLSNLQASEDYEQCRDRAFDLVASAASRQAFDISRESEKTRERYGRHIFGQSALVARRLVESGVGLVQVNFVRRDNGRGGQGYDSHSVPPSPPHLPWCEKELFPPTDAAFAALVEDLHERGMLDETLVVLMGEFGRTPKFNKNGGRDHWPGCYSLVLAGGGVAGGHVYGASDSTATTPTRDVVSPNDLTATVYHLLGLDHRGEMHDLQQRPFPILDGEPVKGILV